MSSQNKGFHAIVLGASGISGWAFTNQLLQDYPRPGIWDRITGLTRKPMSEEELSYWPRDERFTLASGFDLHNDEEDVLRQKLEDRVKDVESLTHVYYLIQDPPVDFNCSDPFAVSINALRRTLSAIESLAPNLRFVHLQYGTFIYGVCFTNDFYHPVPLVEDLPPLKKPLCDMLHYQTCTNFMGEFSKGKSWRWCETRPDEIIGFVPRMNAYNAAYPIAMYLSLFAHINGQGAECPFPGSFGAWKALSNIAGADIIAKAAIHLSLLDEPSLNGEGYNVASSASPANWEMTWPAICSWFGLVGKPPIDNETDKTGSPGPDEYISMHDTEYKEMVDVFRLKGWPVSSPSMDGSPNWELTKLNFDRHLSLQKLKSTGFKDDEEPAESWIRTFERMRKAKVIP
ncbi:predicted protein [Uncinocarpus reesii 1704]|uniref:PRISE-like Rossmann-fold domain-containing protein n=1 Tax=Uncinocarpus reesii (strain UAMH 1704) TaxID=336963 RepID=C4JJS6_UNCRE|nr:uncharacterized protein UREG_01883 [Uncinocarpus reesii 1704]EEP77034.1 predicted protein [Uncinocarpus reesii 1704]